MGYEAMAEDVLSLLDREGLVTATLLGHSMGGKVAMTLALRHPTRVQALIMVDIAPVRYPNRLGPIVAAMQKLPLQELPDRAAADRRLAREIADPQLRQYLLQNLVRGENGFRWRLNLTAITAAMEELLRFPEFDTTLSYRGPTCVIAGEHSDYILPEHDGVLAARFPRAQRAVIPGAGHWLNTERPEAVIEAIEAFLERTGTGPPPSSGARIYPQRAPDL